MTTTSTALPSSSFLAGRLAAEGDAYRTARGRIARLSLVDVLVTTRAAYPTAVAVAVDTTDQDYSGALVTTDRGALAADGSVLSTDRDGWSSDVWASLSNLDDLTRDVWDAYATRDEFGHVVSLDLLAVEADVAALMAAGTPA